jgi:hypothetical protein
MQWTFLWLAESDATASYATASYGFPEYPNGWGWKPTYQLLRRNRSSRTGFMISND